MREKNLFTYSLAAIGIMMLVASLLFVYQSANIPEMLLLSAVMSILGLFPVKLPNQSYYSFDTVVITYILIGHHWTYAHLVSICAMLVFFIRAKPKNTPIRWFRILVSMGIYGINNWTGYQAFHLAGAEISLLTVVLVAAAADLSSLLTKTAIQASILGRSALHLPNRIDLIYNLLLIGLSSFITLRLVQAGTFRELVQELIFSAIILFLFTKMSDLNQKQAAQLEEKGRIFEEFLDADDRLCLQLDREGAIEFANSAVEHVLGYSREDLRGTSVWGIVATERSVMEAAWQSALEGSRGAVTLTIRSEDGRTISCKATLLPAVRNNQVTGVYLIVQSYGVHHEEP